MERKDWRISVEAAPMGVAPVESLRPSLELVEVQSWPVEELVVNGEVLYAAKPDALGA